MIGIIPSAGHATRMLGLPKMLLPVGDSTLIGTLIERMRSLRPSAIHIATHRPALGYLTRLYGPETHVFQADTRTMSETVLLSRADAGDATVLFGMPDTYFDDGRAFSKLAATIDAGADVAVGVFEARPGQHREGGMVTVGQSGRVTDVIDKPDLCPSPWIWGVLAWKACFWDCIDAAMPHVGYALPVALDAGLDVRAVVMDGGYWDCGTTARYYTLIRHLTEAYAPARSA